MHIRLYVKSRECRSPLLSWHDSRPYKRMGIHFLVISSKITSLACRTNNYFLSNLMYACCIVATLPIVFLSLFVNLIFYLCIFRYLLCYHWIRIPLRGSSSRTVCNVKLPYLRKPWYEKIWYTDDGSVVTFGTARKLLYASKWPLSHREYYDGLSPSLWTFIRHKGLIGQYNRAR